MKNGRREKSETKNPRTNTYSGENSKTTEESASHKEVKILLALVAGILTLLIGGSVFLNFQDHDDLRLAAMEEALLNNKSRMLREYDPLLVNAVKIHDYEETHQSRDYHHMAVTMAVPNLQEVYDYYFDEMITQKVWVKEDPQSSLQNIYRQAVEQAEMSVYPLEEDLLLKEEEGGWRIRNPEVLDLVLPHNPTEEIAKDFQNVLAEMGSSLDFPEDGRDPVLEEVMAILIEENFFNEISFDWHRDPEGKNYRITANFHEIKKIQEVGGVKDFRHRREEIVDRQSLVDIVLEEVKEKTRNERDLRTFEIREYDQPSDNDWGYRLISRGGHIQYYRQLMEDLATFPHIARVNFQQLENYYKSTHVTVEDPWPKALTTVDYENRIVVARYNEGEDRRKLILEGGELWYRVYDSKSLKIIEEIMIYEDVQQEDVLNEDLSPYYSNEIKRRNGYDLVIYGIDGEYKYRVDQEPELTATKLTLEVGNFLREEFFYLADRLYHMGEREMGNSQEQKAIQLTDVENEQALIAKSYDELSDYDSMIQSKYFVSEAHDALIVYYQGSEELVEEKLQGNSLQIYQGTEAGLELNDRLTEAFRDIGVIRNLEVMDQNRIFLVNHQNEQWILDLEKNIKISAEQGLYEQEVIDGETGETEKDAETEEEPEQDSEEWVYGEFEEYHYRFTPLSDNLFFAELFIHSSSDGEILRQEIWNVDEKVTRRMIISENESGYALTYSLEDQVFVAMKDNQELLVLEADTNALENLSGVGSNIKIKELMEHEAFTLLDRYQDVNEGLENGQLMIYGQHYFFSPNHKFYSTHTNNFYNPYRYDRSTGHLFYFIRGGDPYMRVLHRKSSPLLPLWDYDELKVDRDFDTLYYEDHEGARIYDLKAFLESLKTASKEDREDRGTE